MKAKTTKVEVIPKNQIVKIEKDNKPVVQRAQDFTIKVSADETNAYGVLQQIKDRIKFVEGKRKEITAPLNASLKAANALFKTLSEPLKIADTIIRDKILDFHQKQEEKAAKREAKLVGKIEEATAKGHIAIAEALVEKSENIKPLVGDSVVQKRWTFEVVDKSKVPVEYLSVDSTAVRAAIRDGERDIPGLRIYQEKGVRVL